MRPIVAPRTDGFLGLDTWMNGPSCEPTLHCTNSVERSRCVSANASAPSAPAERETAQRAQETSDSMSPLYVIASRADT
jgi:hypothetical protein